MTNTNYCVILAGGLGRRLWPCSRSERPKQFIDFFGVGRSLLQQTFDRMRAIVPVENILVSTFADQQQLVCEQLPELPEDNVLAEPVRLSTAPAMGWAAYHIWMRQPDAAVIITPSDHLILHEDRLREQITSGLDFVRESSDFLAMGVRPTAPEPNYGYIQTESDAPVGQRARVKSFLEKPSEEFARAFVESGEFLWNTGLFLCNVQTMLALLEKITPEAAHNLELSRRGELSRESELQLVHDLYPTGLHRTIDLMILENCHNVQVQTCSFGWADVGSWPEVHKHAHHDADGNACLQGGPTLLRGCRNTTVSVEPGHAAVVEGLDGYLVAQQGNVLVVCPRSDDAATLRRLASEAQMKLGQEYV